MTVYECPDCRAQFTTVSDCTSHAKTCGHPTPDSYGYVKFTAYIQTRRSR